MGRPKSEIEVVRIRLNIPQSSIIKINDLIKSGYWGNTPSEVVRRIVDRFFEQEEVKKSSGRLDEDKTDS